MKLGVALAGLATVWSQSLWTQLLSTQGTQITQYMLQNAGLRPQLSGPGAYTLFAVSDSGWSADINANDYYRNPFNAAAVNTTVTYWVSTTVVTTNTMTNGQELPTLDGSEVLAVAVDGTSITVGGSAITNPDVLATNGVLQGMASFITAPNAQLPASTLTELVGGRSELSTTYSALEISGLDERFATSNMSYTLFAPTDAAWQALPTAVFNYLMSNPPALTNVMLTHACMSRQYSRALQSDSFNLLSGQYMSSNANAGVIGLYLANTLVANVSTAVGDYDMQGHNGVLHEITAVLLPVGLDIPGL